MVEAEGWRLMVPALCPRRLNLVRVPGAGSDRREMDSEREEKGFSVVCQCFSVPRFSEGVHDV